MNKVLEKFLYEIYFICKKCIHFDFSYKGS